MGKAILKALYLLVIVVSILLVGTEAKRNKTQRVDSENPVFVEKSQGASGNIQIPKDLLIKLQPHLDDSQGAKQYLELLFSEKMSQFVSSSDSIRLEINNEGLKTACMGNFSSNQWMENGSYVCVWENGHALFGEWENGQLIEGMYSWIDETYDGEWRNMQRHGFGTHQFVSGDVYEGQWEDDLPHGQGTISFEDGDSYEGEWVTGEATGFGVYTFSNGDQIEGQWREGQFLGVGTLITDSYSFVGEIKDAYPDGKGQMLLFQPNIRLLGKFKKGKPTGMVVEESETSDAVFLGHFKAGKKHGDGILFTDEEVCQEQWAKGKLVSKNCSQME